MLRIGLLLLVAHAALAQVSNQDLLHPAPENWLTYGGSYDSQRHTKLDEITPQNVKNLQTAWVFPITSTNQLQTVPLVVDGVMYASAPNEVYALDARTGRKIWQYRRANGINRGPNRGVALFGNLVYVGTPDAHLVALDARTGAVAWEAEIAKASDGYFSPGAPFVADGKVLAGVGGGDSGLNGWLDAYDAETGKLIWRWYTIPRPGEPGHETWAGDSWKNGGGGTWLSGSYDPELGLIYWGLGNPAPDFDGDVRLGDNLYTESIVALELATGKLKWHFQFTPHDVHDWDSVEIPILVDGTFEGRERKLMAHADRNGFYYVLDRETGEFLHGTPFIDQLNWATGLTPEGRPIRVRGVEPTATGNFVCPSTSGATNWMSPAYNPTTGFFYLAVKEGCGIGYKGRQEFRPGGLEYKATGYIESPEEPWQMYVRALDLKTGERQWQYMQVNATQYGAGLISTASGLIFGGDDQGTFAALDARTGAPLWHFDANARISASPISYAVDGHQYVAVAAGVNIIAFRLPDAD